MNKFSVRQIFTGVIVLVVAVAVVYGIYLAGSPSAERDRQLDQRRVSDLQQISSVVDQYYATRRALPPSLTQLDDLQIVASSLGDPESRQPYEYRATGGTTYELCASFALDSSATPDVGNERFATPAKPVGAPAGRWDHPSGRTCFPLDAKQPSIGETCDAYKACGASQVCAKLPGKAEAVCVVAGQECIAAGCGSKDGCVIAKSYPEQVVCNFATDNPAAECQLMRETETGKVDCFSRSTGLDPKAPAGWVEFKPTGVGIPYSCYVDNRRCLLAQ